MVKRMIIAILALLVMVSSVTSSAISGDDTVTGMRMKPVVDKYNALTHTEIDTWAAKFPDTVNHYAKAYIARMSALNIIAGYPEGTFGPNDTLLACHYLTMLVKALGFTPEVPRGQPYWIPYVEIALQEGLVFEGEIADYTGPLTREVAAAISTRALMKYEPAPAEMYYDYNVTKMSDFVYVADQYKQSVVLAYRMGLFMGSNNIFEPKGTFTRAQGAIIINKLLDKNIRVESVPQENEKIYFKNWDCNEYLFLPAKMNANKEYIFIPGSFPLNEVYDVVNTLVSSKGKIKRGYLVQGYDEETQQFYTDIYISKAAADKFYFEDPRFPTSSASFTIWTDKTKSEGALEKKGTGYLYSLNVWDCMTYDTCMKEYTYEILKTLFGSEADKAIALHDKYLNVPMKGLEGSFETTMINGRYLSIGGGSNGFYMEIYAKGAIK